MVRARAVFWERIMAHVIRICLSRLRNCASYVQALDVPSKTKRRFRSTFYASLSGSREVLLRLQHLPAKSKRLLTIGSILLTAVFALIISARSIVDFTVGSIYENVVAPDDVEMPLT